MFCRLLRENCGLNVEDAKKLKKGIFGAGIEHNTQVLECIYARAQQPYAQTHLRSSMDISARAQLHCRRLEARVRSSALVRPSSTKTLINPINITLLLLLLLL
jgi:hypothetical protein